MSLADSRIDTFEIARYIDSRASISPFTLVEIGHGPYPVAEQQPHDFTGDDVYIGIEAGMRSESGTVNEKLRELRLRNTTRNIFFIKHDIGQGRIIHPDPGSDEEDYDGEFNVETILPSKIADEVVASNVFCDPLIGNSYRRTTDLLQEISRLLTPTGIGVLRETISPWRVNPLGFFLLQNVGLKEVYKVTPEDSETWRSLEAVYGNSNTGEPFDSSYYLFLGHNHPL